ncbi:hypothetical protein [Ktedonospora formicarum]|uniref:hypothetical protein n=1 Tax=Ktedonospora formicarum TaxID=2778364 RepID=UPI001C6887E8|nr:hypothetical protein [Ktedonospora formicarum]
MVQRGKKDTHNLIARLAALSTVAVSISSDGQWKWFSMPVEELLDTNRAGLLSLLLQYRKGMT